MTLRSGERYCPITDTFYVVRAGRLPRPVMVRWWHRCPDGSIVRASAQYLSQVQATLYRFVVDGQRVDGFAVAGWVKDPPDWSAFDADHPAPVVRVDVGEAS